MYVPLFQKKHSGYIGKLKALSKNSGKIKMGQTVIIQTANYPDHEFGMIKEKINAMSSPPDKEGNLLINASLPQRLETSYKK